MEMDINLKKIGPSFSILPFCLGKSLKKTTVNSLVSGHPRELKKASVSRAVRLQELFP